MGKSCTHPRLLYPPRFPCLLVHAKGQVHHIKLKEEEIELDIFLAGSLPRPSYYCLVSVFTEHQQAFPLQTSELVLILSQNQKCAMFILFSFTLIDRKLASPSQERLFSLSQIFLALSIISKVSDMYLCIHCIQCF